MGPLQRYQSDRDSGRIVADAAQLEVVEALQTFFESFQIWQSHSRALRARLGQRLFRRKSQNPQGIYLWGGVGRGKTYLMDILYDCLPEGKCMRTHFHRFMQGVHTELQQLQGRSNPLELVAENLARQYKVVCFDEFFVFDIGDAMILGGLLEAMFSRGMILVTTSNIDPDRLYDNGLQRARFIPAIKLIKQNTRVLQISPGDDYRLRALSRAVLYHCPVTAATDAALLANFRQLAPDQDSIREGQSIEILNRSLPTRFYADDVVWFDFSQLCDGPRSAFDYVEIAKLYHALIVSNVPRLEDEQKDQVRRFINLVDELYDRRVKLIISAAVPLAELYHGNLLAFEFDRCVSRLIEMQSFEYLGYEHRA